MNAVIQRIQRHVGVKADGVFGPQSAAAVLRALEAGAEAAGGRVAERVVSVGHVELEGEQGAYEVPVRTAKVLERIDAVAREKFLRFSNLANATAATMNCEYVAIMGLRTWAEQDALYARGRTKPGKIVTNARGGASWHNYGVAVDFGVFRGKEYLDENDPRLAERVHRACAAHAAACGLEWGGDWARFVDTPHYQAAGLEANPSAMRKKNYQEHGTIFV